jgi:hypothetical protein
MHDFQNEVLTVGINEGVSHLASLMKNFAAAFKRPKPEGAGVGSRQFHAPAARLRFLARGL